MTLYEVGIVIGKNLEVHHRNSKRYPIYVSFGRTNVVEGHFLVGVYGNGKTVAEAKRDYCRKLKGQMLCMDDMLDTYRKIQLPKTVTLKRRS